MKRTLEPSKLSGVELLAFVCMTAAFVVLVLWAFKQIGV